VSPTSALPGRPVVLPTEASRTAKSIAIWHIVESKRCAGGKFQRQVLYLGEISDSRREAWCQIIEAHARRPVRRDGGLLPIQHVPDDDFRELHDKLPQLLVFLQERVQVQMTDVRSKRGRVDLTVALAIRRVHACHG
jgi:hypothetical protein